MKGFSFLLKFSYRNLWRAPKRTFIMLFSLMMGTSFIIWDLNFATSGSNEVMKSFLVQYAGRYHVTAPGYYDKKNTKMFDNFRTISDEEINNPEVFELSTKRITAPVFINGEKKTLGILLTGIDVQKELRISKVADALTEGRFISPEGDKEIVIGRRLAEKLDVKIGSEVGIIGQALDGSVANELMTVVGLLDFGGGDLEDSLAFTQFHTAQELMVVPEGRYHQRVSFDMEAEELPKLSHASVTPWDQILPEVGVSVQFVDNFTWVVSCIIVLVISLGLANTLMITFFEREKEFQALNIIGAQMKWITKSLLCEVTIIGILGVGIGCVLGHIFTVINSVYPINLELFTNGKPIIMGGMVIEPLVRFYPDYDFYWQVPLMIFMILGFTMAYPLYRVVQRSKHAI